MAYTFRGIKMINKETLYFFADELEKEGATSVHNVYTGIRNLFGGSSAKASKPHAEFLKWKKKRAAR